MLIDKTTLNDLSIFDTGAGFSVFEKIDLTNTSHGRDALYKMLSQPLESIEKIRGVQDTLKRMIEKADQIRSGITNGTLMVIENFYLTNIDRIPSRPGKFSSLSYKLFYGPDYSLVKYSVEHSFEFLRGMSKILDLRSDNTPEPLSRVMKEIEDHLKAGEIKELLKYGSFKQVQVTDILRYGHFLRYRFKRQILDLVRLYGILDAWNSMGKAVVQFGLTFPEFIEKEDPLISIEGFYHILLENAIPYDLELDKQNKFLFLTGANMAGKSTFIKAVGTTVFLAHTGLGVPAKNMSLTFFEGMLSNINVMDNLVKGESYFYNEVQRIKSTLTRINDGRKWLILIDELFKGTNVEDAMKCSKTVIEGLLRIPNSLFILSTHLYEIGHDLKDHKGIVFNFFETKLKDDVLHFEYRLKPGISQDRLGYLILKQEGVVDLLGRLGEQ